MDFCRDFRLAVQRLARYCSSVDVFFFLCVYSGYLHSDSDINKWSQKAGADKHKRQRRRFFWHLLFGVLGHLSHFASLSFWFFCLRRHYIFSFFVLFNISASKIVWFLFGHGICDVHCLQAAQLETEVKVWFSTDGKVIFVIFFSFFRWAAALFAWQKTLVDDAQCTFIHFVCFIVVVEILYARIIWWKKLFDVALDSIPPVWWNRVDIYMRCDCVSLGERVS